jgi:hypothetical protein
MCFIQNVLCLLETEIEFPPCLGVLLKFFFFLQMSKYITQYLKKRRKTGSLKKAEKALVKNSNVLC